MRGNTPAVPHPVQTAKLKVPSSLSFNGFFSNTYPITALIKELASGGLASVEGHRQASEKAESFSAGVSLKRIILCFRTSKQEPEYRCT